MDTTGDHSLPEPVSGEELTRRNVERVLALEDAEHAKATFSDRLADAITAFSGSLLFVMITVVLVGSWVVFNLRVSPGERIDPFPFQLLTLVLSVEAIFLAIFILMSQNRAARISEKRSQLDLQLNLLSEQENTKMLSILAQIAKAVRAEITEGPEVRVLAEATETEALSDQIDRAMKEPKGRRQL